MSRLSALVAVLVAALAAAFLGWPDVAADAHLMSSARDTGRELRRIAGELRRHPEAVAQPAPLAAAHACLPELQDCAGCHTWTHGVSDDKCLRCHDEIAARRADRAGFHGRLEGACATCHADHDRSIVDLDREAFDHDRALFPLEGSHADVECARCHEVAARCPDAGRRLQYVGLAHAACADCHEDPHAGQFEGTACEACHDARGFEEDALLFRHAALASFALEGRHRDVACAECHRPGGADALTVFRGLAGTCRDCHEDPHAGSTTSPDCASCHSSAGWSGDDLRFDHDAVGRFALDATHRALACDACHAGDGSFAPLPRDCAGCHQDYAGFLAGSWSGAELDGGAAPSPHAGRVACVDCHDTGVARQDASSHAERCARCHHARYAGLFLDRGAHLRALELTARERAGPELRAELARLLRVGSHNYVEAERRLRALAER